MTTTVQTMIKRRPKPSATATEVALMDGDEFFDYLDKVAAYREHTVELDKSYGDLLRKARVTLAK